jgi:hypothetical protein
MALQKIESRLRSASLLIVTGLLVSLTSMFWNHPLSFMVFLFVAAPLCGAGVLVYLLAIVNPPGGPAPKGRGWPKAG